MVKLLGTLLWHSQAGVWLTNQFVGTFLLGVVSSIIETYNITIPNTILYDIGIGICLYFIVLILTFFVGRLGGR